MANINEVFRHCLAVKATVQGNLVPVRYGDARLGFYARNPFMPYSLCPAGVTMEFYSDAKCISFDYIIKRAQDPYLTSDIFDVYENDEYVQSIIACNIEGHIEYTPKNTGKVKYCIYFPIGVHVAFHNLDLGNFEPVEDHRKKLLVIGDSISQGFFGIYPSKAFVPSLARKLDMDYFNHSVGGDHYKEDAIDPELDYKPDVIVVELGTNDIVVVGNAEKIRSNVEIFYEELGRRYPGIPVVTITPFGMGYNVPKETQELLDAVTKSIEEIAGNYGATVLHGTELLPIEPKYFTSDFVHMNDEGFDILSDSVKPYIEAALKK